MQNIGKYEVLQVLGRGGMGTVYEARDPHIGRKVAIKTMSPGFADKPELKARFLREAQAAGGLRHRNIVTVYDLGEDAGQPYIAMELIEGQDLDRVIHGGEALSLEARLDVIRQVCAGLAVAHRNGIVHRDVKPQNIRITPEGEVKIMDFGIAHLHASNLTGSGLVLGSVHYMSPEQVQGRRVDHRCDVFSVGAIAYELLSGRRPFDGESLTEVMYKVTHEGADAAALPRSSYSPELERIVMRALAASPDERYQSLDEMLADLQALTPAAAGPGESSSAGAGMQEGEMAETRAEVERARGDGQLQRALALCQRRLAEAPDDEWASTQAAEIQAQIQDREVEQLCTLALSYAAEGDAALAEKIAARIQAMAPDSPRLVQLRQYLDDESRGREAEALTATAREHLVHGNLEEALACAEAALEIAPEHPAAREIRDRTSRVLETRRARSPEIDDDAVPAPEADSAADDPDATQIQTAASARVDVAAPTVELPAGASPPTEAAAETGPTGQPELVSEHSPDPPAAGPAESGSVAGPPEPADEASPAPAAPPGLPPGDPPAPAPAASEAPASADSPAGSDRRRAEVEALTTAALNAFVLNDYATARKKVQRALTLDPGNRKAGELGKILGALG